MLPRVVLAAIEFELEERTPLGPLRLLDQPHPCLLRQAVCFAAIAGNARTNDILPGCLAPTVARQHVVEIEFLAIQNLGAVLAGVLVALKEVVAGELDLLFEHPVKEKENDHARHADFKCDGVNHLRLGLACGKIAPTLKVVGGVTVRAVSRDNLRVALAEKREGPSDGGDVDSLPQTVQHQHLTVEECNIPVEDAQK